MAQVLTLSRSTEIVRMVIVCGCALALIAAGQAFPLP
jgi:hypothetical protein